MQKIILHRAGATALAAARTDRSFSGTTIKLGLDIHQACYVVAAQEDHATPKPARRFRPEEFVPWVETLLARGHRVFETAHAMQTAAPEVFDLSREDDATHSLYCLERGSTKGFAWQCLIARRLAERGVRFIELIDTGASGNWDAHGNMAEHAPLAKNVDQPIAALLTDLKHRGMLEETLVVWATEFGRTPFNTATDAAGREHHAQAFSYWLAGGGVKGGFSFGETDEFGSAIVADAVLSTTCTPRSCTFSASITRA